MAGSNDRSKSMVGFRQEKRNDEKCLKDARIKVADSGRNTQNTVSKKALVLYSYHFT